MKRTKSLTPPARNNSAAGDPFAQLETLSKNLWWSWQPQVPALFEALNPRTFRASNQNPIVALRKCGPAKRRALASDHAFASQVRDAYFAFQKYLRAKTWFKKEYAGWSKGSVAYFCMEYALHESVPLYAGGLGVLAGDHLKSASDLGVPLVAVGIYWKKGYSRQQINSAGRQVHRIPRLDLKHMPLSEVRTPTGRLWRLRLPMGGHHISVRAWKINVGRIPLLLLDTDLPENKPKDRKLSHSLYSGDRETRIRQEILLGIGGWRLLRALGIKIGACHLNEGHAAFLSLERIAERMKLTGEPFPKAMRHIRNTSVFTTHTPVPAGNETFDPALVDHHLGSYQQKLKLTHEQFHDLARVKPGDAHEPYGMTPLALRTSRYANGVAKLHGQIARTMWRRMYPGRKTSAVPIGHVTNGIHLQTWLHPKLADIFNEYLGTDWPDMQDRKSLWKKTSNIPDALLWSLRCKLKNELVDFCRERMKAQLRRDPVRGMKLADTANILDPNALTIGFARRFATYKRATLIFRDTDRLAKILNNQSRPVQIIFAGKAHPADTEGQALVADVVRFSRMPKFRKRIVFLEDYDMNVARHMVAGVDVWLNNPERPREASGTSGMKPALHGGLNLSILDGWWPEAHNGINGWAIGKAKNHTGTDEDDERDASNLYNTLEKKVAPLYFKRDSNDLPSKWIARMKNAMQSIPPTFNSHRQVKQYLTRYYLPAMRWPAPRKLDGKPESEQPKSETRRTPRAQRRYRIAR